ncbi:efflux RND transporter periplasmic adaptor subunit [Roseateles saccharophilus]|uniref:RND family efflux transporter MFP subunit n=1 Tax=Roseateles saccharophilus TaxID=304 RepID=A0A4R3VFI7_ROSSA|nr:efflux RND transporter periplasmic adaptor subunit [Roseateles saccharophilus]MDG0832196.1 efflux RND transporter periplasmic adaptor subunit [Roseateles saccharophilus]TCV02429.1 RND family efflux transporter MFP subunit [Roseateles saccharophilus]
MTHRPQLQTPTAPRLLSLLALAALLALSGCQKPGAEAAEAKAQPPLRLAMEDRLVLGQSEHSSGPLITGAVQPERRADLRSELSAIVLQVLKENGELVHKGDLLVRLDATSIRDSLTSAEEAARAAHEAFEQSDRQWQRQKALQAQGMISQQALEDAQNRRAAAMSEKVAAEARLVAARQQMARTEVRAPFDGVVSERQVSPGDTAQVGKALLKVLDPASMRFEGYVSADRRAELKVGQAVDLRINGAANPHAEGRIRRIDVAADPVTRQVALLVDFVDPRQAAVAGLYGEGHVRTTSVAALMLGEADLQRDGDRVFAWVVKDAKLRRQPIVLGERDERSGEFVIKSGLASGDMIIRNPSRTLVEGTAVQQAAAQAASAASAGG